MNREDILQALARLNDAIASLNVRLHPPPTDPQQQQDLETELASAQQSQETLEAALNNLPEEAPAPAFAAPAAVRSFARNMTAQNRMAISMSKAARKHADELANFAEPVFPPTVTGGVKPPRAKRAAAFAEPPFGAEAHGGTGKPKTKKATR